MKKLHLFRFIATAVTLLFQQNCCYGQLKLATDECINKHDKLSSGIHFLGVCKKQIPNERDTDTAEFDKHECFLKRWYCVKACTKEVQCPVKSVLPVNYKIDSSGRFETFHCVCGFTQCKENCMSTYDITRSTVEFEFGAKCGNIVCQASLVGPVNTQNCRYESERADGLIDDQVSFVCECLSGYATAGGTGGTTTESVCQSGVWTKDPLEDCVPSFMNDNVAKSRCSNSFSLSGNIS